MEDLKIETITQAEYARLTGKSPQFINKAINGRLHPYVIERKLPSGKVERRLSTAVLTEEELIRYREQKKVDKDTRPDIKQGINQNAAGDTKNAENVSDFIAGFTGNNALQVFYKTVYKQIEEKDKQLEAKDRQIEEKDRQIASILATLEPIQKELSMLRTEVQQLRQEQSSSTAAPTSSAAPEAPETADQAHGNPDPAAPEAVSPAAPMPMGGSVSTTSTEPKTVKGFLRWATDKINKFIG